MWRNLQIQILGFPRRSHRTWKLRNFWVKRRDWIRNQAKQRRYCHYFSTFSKKQNRTIHLFCRAKRVFESLEFASTTLKKLSAFQQIDKREMIAIAPWMLCSNFYCCQLELLTLSYFQNKHSISERGFPLDWSMSIEATINGPKAHTLRIWFWFNFGPFTLFLFFLRFYRNYVNSLLPQHFFYLFLVTLVAGGCCYSDLFSISPISKYLFYSLCQNISILVLLYISPFQKGKCLHYFETC